MIPAAQPRQTGRSRVGLGHSRGGDDYSCMRVINDAMAGPIAALVDRGEEHGCLDLSEIDELAQTLDLEDEDVGQLYERIKQRGIDLRDDCGREADPAPLDDAALATATTDTLQLFLNEIGRHRLLTPHREIDLAPRLR